VSGSQRRVRQLAALFALGLAVVVLHLAYVMVVEHDAWLGRSYQNRWAFRDVPTRRGSLQDRHGRWLAEDEPCWALELHYWAFRRYDPVGAAVEGARLALDVGDYHHATRACQLLLAIGVDRLRKDGSRLRKDGSNEDDARDLRFYLSSLLSTLTNASHFQISQRLRQAAEAGSRAPVYQVLGLDPGELLTLFEARLGELAELDRRVAVARPDAKSLWENLETAREDRQAWLREQAAQKNEDDKNDRGDRPPPDQRLVRIGDQLPFDVTLCLASIRERHPGLMVHPSVRRVRNTLPGRTDLASLEPFLGRVARAFWHADQEERDRQLLQQQLDRMEVELDELPDGDGELSDLLQQQVRDRARKAVHSHLLSRGRVGTSGLEKELDLELRGGPGLRFVERSRRVRERRLWGSFNVTPGIDLRLTIDLRLQVLLEQSMDEALASLEEDQEAAMAVINTRGDVLALVSRPLGKLPAAVSWSSSGAIGSVGKPFVLLEHLDAIRHGRPHKRHQDYRECVGTYARRLGCDHSHYGDAKDPVKALGQSCNFFFYQAAEGLDRVGVLDAYRRFGLAPNLPPARGRDVAEARFAGRHQRRIAGLWLRNPVKTHDRIPERLAIGYGIEANDLSIARAYAGLATGKLPELSFVRDQDRGLPVDLGLHPDDLAVVRDGLEHCVREGTAKREQRLGELGVLAKTGTATVDKPTSKINNAWLAGYLTRERPTLVFAAVVYKVRGYGAAVSGPLVTAFLDKLRNDAELREIYL